MAHAITEAQKSHDVPSATCRPTEAGRVGPGQPQRLENQGREGGKNPNLGHVQLSPAPCRCAPGCARLKKDTVPRGWPLVQCMTGHIKRPPCCPATPPFPGPSTAPLSQTMLPSSPLFPTLRHASLAASHRAAGLTLTSLCKFHAPKRDPPVSGISGRAPCRRRRSG